MLGSLIVWLTMTLQSAMGNGRSILWENFKATEKVVRSVVKKSHSMAFCCHRVTPSTMTAKVKELSFRLFMVANCMFVWWENCITVGVLVANLICKWRHT